MSDQPEELADEVVIHQTQVIGGDTATISDQGPPTNAPRFTRSAPLPTRVRDGALEQDHLLAGGEIIPWTSIHYLALGVIDQMVKDSELKKGPLRKMVSKVVGGEDNSSPKDRAKQVRQVFLLDVFTDLQDQPFRFEAGNINYKSFLDRVGYVSQHNFFRFCVHFSRHVPHALITKSMAAFLGKRRDRVAHFPDFHDFELETDQQLKLARDIVPMEGIDLSKDSWIDEWSEDE